MNGDILSVGPDYSLCSFSCVNNASARLHSSDRHTSSHYTSPLDSCCVTLGSCSVGHCSYTGWLISKVNSDGRGLFVRRDSLKKKRKWRAVLLFGRRGSGTLLCRLVSSAQISRVILPLSDSAQSRQWCFEKALFVSGWDHVVIHLSSARWLSACPPSVSLSASSPPLPLLFSPSGLYHQRGEMAPGQLRRYSGNVCRRGSRGGKIFIPPSHLVQTFISTISIPYWHVTCMGLVTVTLDVMLTISLDTKEGNKPRHSCCGKMFLMWLISDDFSNTATPVAKPFSQLLF